MRRLLITFRSFKNSLYIFLGSLALILGSVGIILPLLPTTPFLLLSGYFYIRSSRKLYLWLIHHPVFGAYIYSYLSYKAIPFKTKVMVTLFLWPYISFSTFLIDRLFLSILLVTFTFIVTGYIW